MQPTNLNPSTREEQHNSLADLLDLVALPAFQSFLSQLRELEAQSSRQLLKEVQPHEVFRYQGEVKAYQKAIALPETMKTLIENANIMER